MQKENLLTEDQKMILHHWPAITGQVNAVDFLNAIGKKIQAQVKEKHEPYPPKNSCFIVITTEDTPEGHRIEAETCGTPVDKAMAIKAISKKIGVKKILKKAREAEKSKLPDAFAAFREALMEKLKEAAGKRDAANSAWEQRKAEMNKTPDPEPENPEVNATPPKEMETPVNRVTTEDPFDF